MGEDDAAAYTSAVLARDREDDEETLHQASRGGHEGVVQLLLEKRADLEEDLLADAHLQQTVASKMEEEKKLPFTVRGTFTPYPCEKPSSPAPRAYRPPASLASTLKRARVTDEVKLAEFIQTLATLFPAE